MNIKGIRMSGNEAMPVQGRVQMGMEYVRNEVRWKMKCLPAFRCSNSIQTVQQATQAQR